MNLPKEEIDQYKNRLVTTFSDLKRISTYEHWIQESIPIGKSLGNLRSICDLHANDKEIISKLALWREQATTFRDTFKITFDGTKRWLHERLLDVPDRILFLVIDSENIPIGHMGFDRSLNDDCILNFDNIIRGAKRTNPEIMFEAVKSMFSWAYDVIKPKIIMSTPVMEYNTNSVRFHNYAGFKFVSKKLQDKITPDAQDEYEMTFIYEPNDHSRRLS